MQIPKTGFRHRFRDHLKITAGFVQTQTTSDHHLHPIAHLSMATQMFVSKKHTPYLRMLIFQGEIPMTRTGFGQIRNFPLHRHQPHALL